MSLAVDTPACQALALLSRFRVEFYECFYARPDALFELTDAVLCADGPVKTLVELSLAAEHRRGHGALYAALDRGWLEPARLRRTLARLPLPKAADGRIVLAVDVSNWLRPDAPTSDDRLFCHVYGRGDRSRDQFVPGWPYSFVAALETGRTSWVALLDAVRLGQADDATAVTAAQLHDVVERLTQAGHWQPGDPEILITMDSGYDVAYLSHALADLPVVLVGRLRSDRVMLRDAGSARSTPRGGRPRRHGGVLTFAKPESWHRAEATTTTDTTRYGRAEAIAWDRMHPRLTHRGPWLKPHHGGTADPARDVGPSHGRAPAGRPGPETGLAVVLGHRRRTGRRGPLVAVVPPPLRPGTHLPADEADARLDRPEDLPRRQRRPVDLARHRRPHPAPPRPAAGRGPPPPLGAARRAPPPHPRPGATGVSQHPPDHPRPAAPKPTTPGPGRPPGSKNKQQATRHNVGKTVKRADTIKDHQARQG
ncbi:hypothetical protein GCM10009759_45520 [Kitasatospora saccharophila]|uniref:Transposase IS701-like DDE domain-containing protein n=1 Tax=Kitasatospora saccharophila TaxID=407973 RepID=A0ABN2XB63_9ACTN